MAGKRKPTKTQVALTLYYLGYSYAQIAEITNNKRANVSSLIVRARTHSVDTETPTPYSQFSKEDKATVKQHKRKLETFEQEQLAGQENTELQSEDEQTIQPEDEPEEVTPLKQKVNTAQKDVRIELEDETVSEFIDEVVTEGNQQLGGNESSEDSVNGQNTGLLSASDSFKVNHFNRQVARAESVYEPNTVCTLCNGKGWAMKPSAGGAMKITCPVCLGQSKKSSDFRVDEDHEELLYELIPNRKYRESHFDHQKFVEQIEFPLEYRGRSFDQYQVFIDDVLVGLSQGKLPTKSYYIVAPDGFGKKWFAYEVIKLCIKNGFKSTGLLDPIAVSAAIDNRDAYALNRMLDTDIIMLNITSMRQSYNAHIFQYLTEEADSRGIPLFIFSRVTALTIIKGDRSLSGMIRSHTQPYDYGELEEIGILGREHTLAEKHRKTTNNQSIGYSEQEQKEDYIKYKNKLRNKRN